MQVGIPKGGEAMTRTVIWGSPCSGKTTYVRKRMKPGDLVCDFDALYQAISFLPSKKRVANLKSVTFELLYAVHGIIKNHPELDAWIITASKNKKRAKEIAEKLDARFVFLDITREEAHKRCVSDNRPEEWHEFIDKWFDAQSGESAYVKNALDELESGDLLSRLYKTAEKEIFRNKV